jgi:hypothetical protein
VYSIRIMLKDISGQSDGSLGILRQYKYPHVGLRVEVVDGSDYRVDTACEIEAEAMKDLGDPIEEVRAEFAPYRKSSLFYLAFLGSNSGASHEEICGMGRIIPGSAYESNKTLSDLSVIPGWSVPDIRELIGSDGATVHRESDVEQRFKTESGCTDLSQVWDIATLAPNPKYVKRGLKSGAIATALIAAFTNDTVNAYDKGQITHCTSFNEVKAHDFFVELGFPFRSLFDLPPMTYDSFHSEKGMIAQPAWLAVEGIVKQIQDANSRFFREYGYSFRPETV